MLYLNFVMQSGLWALIPFPHFLMHRDGARQTVFLPLSSDIFYMNVSIGGLGRAYGGRHSHLYVPW